MTKLVDLSEFILITAYISAFYTDKQESKVCIDQYFGYSDYLYLDDELIDIPVLTCTCKGEALVCPRTREAYGSRDHAEEK